MGKTVTYKCCACQGEFEVDYETHKDGNYYAECGHCREMALPANESDYDTHNTVNS